MNCDDETGTRDCREPTLDRLRYFTGRHMSARDFQDADEHHRSFRHLHNRVLHGWGIACGLEVKVHPRPECRRDRVVVQCGLALDCCGREILVRRKVVSPDIPWDTRPQSSNDEAGRGHVLLLCLRYRETLIEKVPVLYSRDACSSPALEWGRIREGYELCWRWVQREDLLKYGWLTPATCAPPDPRNAKYEPAASKEPAPHDPESKPEHCPPEAQDDDADCPESETSCCLDLSCPPEHWVPLAALGVAQSHGVPTQAHIDVSGRRSLARSPEHLTHVCWMSWTHGGIVRASDLDCLRVRFDRALRVEPRGPTQAGPRGINERTFVAQYGEQDEDLDFLEYRRPPFLASDRRTAVFEIRDTPRKLINHVIHVTLRCDFILDCKGNPVDGDHLRGELPSGDGVPGGLFESWFSVVSDDDYDRLEAQGARHHNASTKD